MNVISAETRMMGLPYGEEIMIVGRTMWTQSTSVTDRETKRMCDRQTDRISITNTVQRIASHGKNYFTDRLSRKLAMQRCVDIPPHLTYVATLPCET